MTVINLIFSGNSLPKDVKFGILGFNILDEKAKVAGKDNFSMAFLLNSLVFSTVSRIIQCLPRIVKPAHSHPPSPSLPCAPI